MSRRSYDGLAHEKRMSKYRVTDDDVLNYTLRVALLAHIISIRPAESAAAAERDRERDRDRDRDYTSRARAALSSSMDSVISLGDVFSASRGSSTKFPEKMVKVLEQRLQMIAMGKDAHYTNQYTRRAAAVFFGQLTQDSFRRQVKENRRVEELILMYATHCTAVLKKEPTLAAGGWKVELNAQIASFVGVLRECLRGLHHVSPELVARLDTYAEKLTPTEQQRQAQQMAAAASDSGYDSASNRDSVYSLSGSAGVAGGISPGPSTHINAAEVPLIMTVATLFQLDAQGAQHEIDQLKRFCDEKGAVQDLKLCLKNIASGAPFPGRREDFDSDDAWAHWRTLETSHLSQMMLAMVKSNPELGRTMPAASATAERPSSVYNIHRPAGSISQANRRSYVGSPNGEPMSPGLGDGEDEDGTGSGQFTYIPPHPKKFYRRLLELCISADLEAMLSDAVDDDDEVSLGILTLPHLELLNECALRWRIGQPYRATAFLDIVRQFYERNDVPLECIPEALQSVEKVKADLNHVQEAGGHDLALWPVSDHEYLATVYGQLFGIFLSALFHAMDNIPNLKLGEIGPFLMVIEHVRDSGLLERFDTDVEARLAEVETRVRERAGEVVAGKYDELCAAQVNATSAPSENGQAPPLGPNWALPLLFLSDELENTAKKLDKRFSEPLLGQIDIVSLVVGEQIPFFVHQLDQSRQRLYEGSVSTNPAVPPSVPIQDVFALYRRTKTLLDMYRAFTPQGDMGFELGEYFEPYVRQWLVATDNKTAQWVQAAIAADTFTAEDETQGHSSSIVDLFESLKSPITFLQDLNWSDQYQEARFFTSVAKTISKAVEQYCRSMEELFMAEMFPRPADFLQPQKSSAWIEKAKSLAISEKKIELFNFQPASCVKLNNIQAARRLLDNLYNQMDAERLAQTIEEHAPPVPEKQERQRYLFTLKIAIAEGLVPLDSSPNSKLDTFVTLSDEGGHRMAKTRTIYETLNPRFDETYDLTIEQALWLMVSVRDRALVGKHDTVGRAYICLDPRKFADFLTHDIWLDLDTRGRILLRVSMEGEKDDVLFYFGRAFRSLKRSDGDMVRIFIDKMAPVMQSALSRPVLRSLINTGKGLDYQKAIGNVTALYKQALGATSNEVQIPLPQAEKPRIRPDELTDVQIEAALAPLFDYFDAQLPTLNTYLSESAKENVMKKIWKELLNTIEGLLVPPLSEVQSDLKPLTDKEVDIVFKWLKFLRDYFYIGGEGPMSIEELQNQKFRDVMSIRLYYDWHSDALMEECVRMMQQQLRAAPTLRKKAKSVYSQRSLGTIKDRKREKKEEKDVSSGEVIMRILRMRPGTQDFIAQQLQIMQQMQAEQERRAQQKAQRGSRSSGLRRPRGEELAIPAIPEVPSIPE